MTAAAVSEVDPHDDPEDEQRHQDDDDPPAHQENRSVVE
jgi:hypothetical protein